MVKESIINLKKALSNSLQTVPNLIEVLKRGLDGIEEAAEEQSTYSTDERVVGKWIDGSNIYEKIIDIGTLPNTDAKLIAHNITNLNTVIKCESIGKTTSNNRPIPNIYDDGTFVNIIVTNTNLRIYTNRDLTSTSAICILRYTKTSTTRSPEENDTKNDGNEEKNTNER